MSHIRKVNICDGNGNPLSSYLDPVTGKYVLDVHDADVHKRVVNRRFHRHTTPATTIAVASSPQDTSITVVSDAGFTTGDYLHIENGIQELAHPQITALPGGNVLTLDKPLDSGYAIGTDVVKVVVDMSETGTLAAPLSYIVQPLAGEVWHITKVAIAMAHSSAGDLGTFGNRVALPNGVLLRKYNGATSTYGTFTVWKTNGDIDLDTGNVTFPVRSGGGGSYGTAAAGRLKQDTESIAYLDGEQGDFLEILVQDDLSTLGFVLAKAQGHFE